jgi:hypothetical protein
MKYWLPLLLISTPAIANAQTIANPQPTMNEPNYSTDAVSARSHGHWGSRDTPTMKRQKLARALALRDEAAQLLAKDGGTFSDRNRAYIERKRDRILSR